MVRKKSVEVPLGEDGVVQAEEENVSRLAKRLAKEHR
jgi:hypothetical protein